MINGPKETSTLIRHSAPSNEFDLWPYGTICRVNISEDQFDLYEQLSKDESRPNWVKK